MSRRIAAIITAIIGDRIIIGEDELKHAMEEHFSMLPTDMILELIERVLKDPTKISYKRNSSNINYFIDLTIENT